MYSTASCNIAMSVDMALARSKIDGKTCFPDFAALKKFPLVLRLCYQQLFTIPPWNDDIHNLPFCFSLLEQILIVITGLKL